MASTTNYSWSTPDDTSLVKDGASAIRTLGSSIDTTTKNLNPETTLGDLAYRSSTANVKTRLALGTAGQVLKVNSGATAPEWATPASAAPASATSYVSTNQTTTSSSFVNLATTQSVTVTTGTKALIAITLRSNNDTANNETYTSFAVTGASSVSEGIGNNTIIHRQQGSGNNPVTVSGTFYLTGLTAGSNTFTLKFASGFPYNGAYFSDRVISVIDMGS